MKRKQRLKLTTFQYLTHYGVVIFLLFIVCLSAWDLIRIYRTQSSIDRYAIEEFISLSWPFLLLAVVFTIIQYRRLKFHEINVSYTEEQFQEAIRRTVEELDWHINNNRKTFFRATRPWSWSFSWGEMVTIIKYKDRLLINSICDPDQMSSVISYGWNRKNINTFLKNLDDVKAGRPVTVKVVKVSKEWSVKGIAMRLIAYPLCVFFITLGILMFFKPGASKAFIAGIVAISIPVIYLYSDIKILLIKNAKSKGLNG